MDSQIYSHTERKKIHIPLTGDWDDNDDEYCVHFHELLTLTGCGKKVFELARVNIVSEMEGQGTSLCTR